MKHKSYSSSEERFIQAQQTSLAHNERSYSPGSLAVCLKHLNLAILLEHGLALCHSSK